MQGSDDAHDAHQEGGRHGLAADRYRDECQDRAADDERQERHRPGATRRGRIRRQHDERADRRRHRDGSDDSDRHPEHRQDHEAEQAGPEVETLTVDRHQFLDEGRHGGIGGMAVLLAEVVRGQAIDMIDHAFPALRST